MNHRSCEMLAVEVINYVRNQYPMRWVTATVSEDGENGGTVRYIPSHETNYVKMKGTIE